VGVDVPTSPSVTSNVGFSDLRDDWSASGIHETVSCKPLILVTERASDGDDFPDVFE
jgi:hypothetical protein